jgi:iron-sulfur cluster repair protein YtfE (RIC family)
MCILPRMIKNIAETTEAILAQLDSHFEKAEQILFPMIEAMLDETTQTLVARQMETLVE